MYYVVMALIKYTYVAWNFLKIYSSTYSTREMVKKQSVYRVFRISQVFLIPEIGQLWRLGCVMISISEKSKGSRNVIFNISFSPKAAAKLKKKFTEKKLIMIKFAVCFESQYTVSSICKIKAKSGSEVVGKILRNKYKQKASRISQIFVKYCNNVNWSGVYFLIIDMRERRRENGR